MAMATKGVNMFTLEEIKHRAKDIYAMDLTENETERIKDMVEMYVSDCICCNETLNNEIEQLMDKEKV